MVLSYRIREAALDDNDRLIELMRRCPIEGSLQIVLDRSPDFFALTRLQGERSFVYVAENLQGDVIGSVTFIERLECHAGRTYRVLRLSDLRTDPCYRRTRMAANFVEIYRKTLLEGGYHYGMAELWAGHYVPVKTQRLLGEDIVVKPLGSLELFQVFPLWTFRRQQPYQIRQANTEDLPRILDLLLADSAARSGTPPFSTEWLQDCVEQHASFRVEDIWIAEDPAGELVACVGVWDQKGLRRTIATRFSRTLRFVIFCLTWLGALWRMPPPPVEGEALRYLYLRWPTFRAGHRRALRGLLKTILRELKLRGEHQFVMIGFHEMDPRKGCLRGFFKLKQRIQLYRHQVKTSAGELPHSPATLPFSDPSLF